MASAKFYRKTTCDAQGWEFRRRASLVIFLEESLR